MCYRCGFFLHTTITNIMNTKHLEKLKEERLKRLEAVQRVSKKLEEAEALKLRAVAELRLGEEATKRAIMLKKEANKLEKEASEEASKEADRLKQTTV